MNPRDNPFAAHRIERLPFRLPGGLTWDALWARLAVSKYCGAIVGPHGSGKTTLLEQLVPELKARDFTPHLVRLTMSSTAAERNALLTHVRRLRAPDLLLLDGAEQLSTREWLSLRSAVSNLAGCIITVHRACRLPTLLETVTSPALLDELAAELSGSSLPGREAAALHVRHRGNLREVFRELYDRWAIIDQNDDLREATHIQADLFLR